MPQSVHSLQSPCYFAANNRTRPNPPLLPLEPFSHSQISKVSPSTPQPLLPDLPHPIISGHQCHPSPPPLTASTMAKRSEERSRIGNEVFVPGVHGN
ncbi:hypothetical protein BDD12DRAFT_850805 [Trichophaea hybrida]|nr:hypothetical protein BDD12DRAFT_850805 [Trichophaea hybrida]